MNEWTRIPAEITNDADRRTLAGILTSIGLEVRVVRVRFSKNGTIHRFAEFREQEKGVMDEHD